MKISDLAYDAQGNVRSPWRADLQPARFRNAYFHIDGGGFETGRRVVVHEFPKKDLPYSEDMGRRAIEFTVRGYCIQYPRDIPGADFQLYRRDYRIARDILIEELNSGKPGVLYLPTFAKNSLEIMVICPRYRLSEEEKYGGYCVFDMTFQELGAPPGEPTPDSSEEVQELYQALRERMKDLLGKGTPSTVHQSSEEATTT